jgi:hypothetical protein
MLRRRPVQTERWIPRRRILKAEVSSSLKKWNLGRKRLLFHCRRYHRPLGLWLLQVREKEHECFSVTVMFVATFSFRSFSSLLVT